VSYTLELPALDGRDPLGFLAALGTLRLLTEESSEEVRLSFSDKTAAATLHGPYESHDQVVTVLSTVIDRIPSGGCLPNAPITFPPRQGQRGGDPIRVTRADYRAIAEELDDAHGGAASTWLSAIVTDLATDDAGRVARTMYSAATAKQSMRTFFENATSWVRRNPQSLFDALTSWRRVSGFFGEHLDHGAWRSTADHPAGDAALLGVPGATWLAVMALPLLRLGGDGGKVANVLWHQATGEPAVMVWPIWRQALDVRAVLVMIEHPSISPSFQDGAVDMGRASMVALRVMGVFAMGAARRVAVDGRGYNRPLAPLPVHLAEARP
jgi:hypothetical protein